MPKLAGGYDYLDGQGCDCSIEGDNGPLDILAYVVDAERLWDLHRALQELVERGEIKRPLA